jgi:hypothetical protein
VDAKGRPRFNDLLFRRRNPVFFAFDLLYLNGKDLRYEQLSDRKAVLRQVLNSRTTTSALQYADDVSGSGVALYERVCEMDLEGIVAKHKTAPCIFRTMPSVPGTKSKIPAIPKWQDATNSSSKNGTLNRSQAGIVAN